MELLATFATPVAIAGDINIDLNRDDDPDADKFNVILKIFSMVPHVSLSNHELGGGLDAVVTGEHHPPKDIEVGEVGLPDHLLITWSIDMSSPLSDYSKKTRRSQKGL